MSDNDYVQSARILAPAVCWTSGAMLILLACCELLRPPFATMGLAFVVVGCTATVCQQLRRLDNARARAELAMGIRPVRN